MAPAAEATSTSPSPVAPLTDGDPGAGPVRLRARLRPEGDACGVGDHIDGLDPVCGATGVVRHAEGDREAATRGIGVRRARTSAGRAVTEVPGVARDEAVGVGGSGSVEGAVPSGTGRRRTPRSGAGSPRQLPSGRRSIAVRTRRPHPVVATSHRPGRCRRRWSRRRGTSRAHHRSRAGCLVPLPQPAPSMPSCSRTCQPSTRRPPCPTV